MEAAWTAGDSRGAGCPRGGRKGMMMPLAVPPNLVCLGLSIDADAMKGFLEDCDRGIVIGRRQMQ